MLMKMYREEQEEKGLIREMKAFQISGKEEEIVLE
jgi:hypothetical protein